MLAILIGAILAVIFIFIAVWTATDSIDILIGVLMGLAGGLLIWLMISLGLQGTIGPDEENEVGRESQEITALGSGPSGPEGALFLGFGTIDGEDVYRYITVDEGGASTLNSVPADRAKVYEHEDMDPSDARVETVKYRNGHLTTLSITRYEFHVPAGTVSHGEFEVSVN